MERIVECVPNFSEGQRPEVIDEIVRAVSSVPGVVVIDREMDPNHNRCVLTFVGDPDSASEAAVRAARRASELIDLTCHQGEHPRMGATDVIPFIPIRNVTMDECVELAKRTGERIAGELGIPVYLYEAAATRPDRVNLANIRKGEFEGLKDTIRTDPDRCPDFGRSEIHPTAGATVVGARTALIAYNINLNCNNIDVAKKIAKAIRGRGGGLSYVKALGFELKDRDLVQVSMNLIDYEKTPIFRAFEFVEREAAHYGVTVLESEIVGLVPQAALDACAERVLQLTGFSRDQVLENRLHAALTRDQASASDSTQGALHDSIGDFPDLVQSGTAVPGGGSVAALSGALSAALGQMMCRMTAGKKKFADVESRVLGILDQLEVLRQSLTRAISDDAESFEKVMQAYQLPKTTDEEKRARSEAVEEATKGAASVPLNTAQEAGRVLELLHSLAPIGNPNLLADLAVGGQMALAAIKGASYNVLVNLASISDQEVCETYRRQMRELVEKAQDLATEIEHALLRGTTA